MTVACRYYGRDFTTDEMALIRALITTEPTRAAIARAFCQRTGWLKPDGGLKFMMAKVTMLAMHRDGLITLPPPRQRPSRRKPIVFGQDTEPPLFAPPTTLDEARPLDVSIVVSGTREGKLWNEFVARYHYLGYTTLVGAQMRYAVHDRNGWPVAMLGFSTAAWKLAPRDTLIGWTPEVRQKNLPLVIDNPRFLILPWIRVDNLGSHILAIMRRRLPGDWIQALQHHAGAHRNVRSDAALHRRRLQGVRMDPCRKHTGPRALRYPQQTRQTQKGHLAETPAQGLETHPQPVIDHCKSPRDRTLTIGFASRLHERLPGFVFAIGAPAAVQARRQARS